MSATATAWMAELHRAARPGTGGRRADVVATAANLGGLGLGALVSGALAEWIGAPLTVPFICLLAA